jgi:hypothetical protein
MKQEKKFRQEEQVSETPLQSQTRETIREFATPEEMLRFDAAQTTVPPAIAERLKKSIGAETKPGQPWWRRLLGESL